MQANVALTPYLKLGGCGNDLLTDAYQAALERAALEAFEGRYDDVELGQKVDRATIEQQALELITVHQEG